MSERDAKQEKGRHENAARPVQEAMGGTQRPEDYPAAGRDDGVEPRSFDPPPNPQPRQGAGDVSPSVNEGRLGPGADPAEGKRKLDGGR